MSHAPAPPPAAAHAAPPVTVARPAERPTERSTAPERSPRGAPECSRAVPAAERYRERLFRYVGRLTAGDVHRAEDIVQETMLRAWLASDEFADGDAVSQQNAVSQQQNEEHLAAWLHIVARNLAVDARRRDRSVPMGIMPTTLLHRVAEGADVADVAADRVALVRSLARLSPHHREVLVHVHVYDRSREDTARLLGIPQGTVKSRLHYALTALRREFAAA